MIVKNEEKNLKRCLESVHGCVDEIIVVDTGSTDATTEVARGFGARIEEFPWQNDFALARNKSISSANGEWILILDADEVLPQETAQELVNLTALHGVEGWTFTIVSPVRREGRCLKNCHLSLRLFRNRPHCRFVGKVHEQIKLPVPLVKYAGMTILHYGYLDDAAMRKEKTLRNIKLLQEALMEEPDNLFYHYNLGVSYFVLGDLKKAISHYEIAFRGVKREAVYAPVLYRNYALCLEEAGEFSQALEVVNAGLALFPDYPDLYFLKGEILREVGFYETARNCFLKCTYLKNPLPHYTTTEGVNDYLALESLQEISSPPTGRLADLRRAFSASLDCLQKSSAVLEMVGIWEQWLTYCQQLVLLSLEGKENTASDAYWELLKLASLKRKVRRLKEALCVKNSREEQLPSASA